MPITRANRSDLVILCVGILAVAALDQLTKYWILKNIPIGVELPIIPGLFNLTLTFNRGAAFGLFANLPEGTRQFVLAATTILALGVVVYFLIREIFADAWARLALVLVLGGALGNIIDRLLRGMVVDFLDFYVGLSHWPAFNIADSAICVGVAILLFRQPRKKETTSDPAP